MGDSLSYLIVSCLEPLRQTSADLNSVNEIRLLIHGIVLAYSSPFLIAISSANRPWCLKHSLPIPPVVVKTKGVNVPCSMSTTLLEYRRFFSFSSRRMVQPRSPTQIYT